MQDALDQIEAAGAQLVVISPEISDSAYSTGERDSVAFLLLSDLGNKVAQEYGIAYTLPESVQEMFAGRLDLAAYNADSSFTLPLAVTYVIDTDRTIRYAFVDPDYRKRAEPSEIIAALKKLR